MRLHRRLPDADDRGPAEARRCRRHGGAPSLKMSHVRFGIMTLQTAPYPDLVERWRRVEALGFDSVWIADHTTAQYRMPLLALRNSRSNLEPCRRPQTPIWWRKECASASVHRPG